MRLNPGTVLGGEFRVVRRLAAGAMGAVFVCEQASTGKQRAVKVMNARLAADEKSRARFEQEAGASGRVASEHVVEVVASGVESTGVTWLAMELLEGEDLAAFQKKRGAIDPATVRVIFAQLGRGLAAAHRTGLVHRDLKPENVFLATPRASKPGEPFCVKILDFGIAKVLLAVDATATVAGMGSPLWMAPEQVVDRGRVRTSTDVWPVGLIAFLLLTGKHYWVSANDESPLLDLLIELRKGATATATARARTYGVEGLLPPGFDAWFARCVCERADERYPDAGAAFEAFEELYVPKRPIIAARGPERMIAVGVAMLALLALFAAWVIHRGG